MYQQDRPGFISGLAIHTGDIVYQPLNANPHLTGNGSLDGAPLLVGRLIETGSEVCIGVRLINS